MANTKLITELTLVTFATGTLYALGQSTRLGWFYLNTFSYNDFLIYAVLVMPIAFVVFAMWQFGSEYIINPTQKLAHLVRKPERNRLISQFGMRAWLGLVTEAIEVFVAPVMIIFMIIFIGSFYLVIAIGFLTLVFFAVSRRFVLKPPPRNQRPQPENTTPKEEKDKTATYIAAALILIFFAGAVSIDFQNHNKPDSEILFSGNPQYVEANILASNSKSVAYWRNGELYIAPRSEILSVKYKYSYMQNLQLFGDESTN